MPVIEDVVFKHGAAQDAVDFKDTKIKLARYAFINYNHGSYSTAMATEETIMPTLMVPTIKNTVTNNKMKMKIWKRKYDKYN